MHNECFTFDALDPSNQTVWARSRGTSCLNKSYPLAAQNVEGSVDAAQHLKSVTCQQFCVLYLLSSSIRISSHHVLLLTQILFVCFMGVFHSNSEYN